VHKRNATTQRGISQLQALTHPVTLPDSQSLQTQRSASQGNVNLPALGERTEKKKKGKRIALSTTVHGSRVLFSFLQSERRRIRRKKKKKREKILFGAFVFCFFY